MPRLRACAQLAAVLAAPAVAACRTATPRACFPERGAEIWVERRYPAASPPPTAPAVLSSFRLGPDTTPAVMAARQARVWIIGPTNTGVPDTIIGGSSGPEGRLLLPAAARALRPGSYRIRLIDIGWLGTTRDLWFDPGERVDLEVQMRQAAYCLEPVTVTSARASRPAA